MLTPKRSLSIQVISLLVAVATIVLMVFALATTLGYRNHEKSALQTRLSLTAEQLQTAAAAALWTIDETQLGRVLDGGMKDRTLTGIIIKTNNKVYARGRNDRWQSVVCEPADIQSGSITAELPILYAGEKLGSITLFATKKFLNEKLVTSSLFILASILLLDILLICSLYFIFNRIVLEPLKNLEKYAISVRSGDMREVSLENLVFTGEMEVLRTSLREMITLLETRYAELQQETKLASPAESVGDYRFGQFSKCMI